MKKITGAMPGKRGRHEAPESEEGSDAEDSEQDFEGGVVDESGDGDLSDVDEDELAMEKAALLHKAQAKTPKINREAELMEKLGDIVLGGGNRVPWAELFYVSSRVPVESVVEDVDDDLKREVAPAVPCAVRYTHACSLLPGGRAQPAVAFPPDLVRGWHLTVWPCILLRLLPCCSSHSTT